MKRTQSTSREFWFAIGVSLFFHVLAGFVFWLTWERMLPEKMDTEMEWTWTAPTSEKMAPGRPAPAPAGGEQVSVAGNQNTTGKLPSSAIGTETKNAPPSSEAAGLKEISPSSRIPGDAAGTTTAPATGTAASGPGRPIGGQTASPVPPPGALMGPEGAADGESTGYALVPPRLRERQAILLPAEAVRAGLSGNVLLLAEILENGRVGKIIISRSSGSKILDESARETLSHWRFEPAWEPQGKKAVRVMTSVWVRYTKEGS